ncbi:hypothetical protein [Haloterrigena salinisoli]|uniref:hypothetical protein n=1 Tax=Haloterrigena salinisoli TaxID=3132747 RepID=UPI0030D27BAE
MERRKILLGSGAALTTALAGCTGSGGGDDEPDDDTESNTDDEPENDSKDTEDNSKDTENTDDSDSEKSDGTDDETSDADIPGFDGSKLSLKSDSVTVASIERTDGTVEVVATSDVTDLEKLYAELGTLADAHKSAIVDLEAFADAIESIDWVVDHEKKKVVSFSVKTEWLVSYKNGDLSAEEFLTKVKSTAE